MRSVLFVPFFALFGCEQRFALPDAGHPISATLRECAADPGSPVTSIALVIDRVNSLPRPVSGPCLVASLQRPLAMVATVGTISAQPAGGEHDPRVFLLADGVVIAVVPGGPGSAAIELGEWMSNTRTLKAEIALPVTQALPADEPFTRLESQKPDGGVTPCGMCHRYEAPHGLVAHGYVSAAYRPEPATQRSLAVLAAEHEACITSGEVSGRCDMFHALLDFGALEQGSFSKDVEYFANP